MRERDVAHLDIFIGPFVEELDVADFCGDFFGQHGPAVDWVFDLDLALAVVRHVCESALASGCMRLAT